MNDMAMIYGPAVAAILLASLMVFGPGWGAFGSFAGSMLCIAAPIHLGSITRGTDRSIVDTARDIDCMVGGILLAIGLVLILRWQERRKERS